MQCASHLPQNVFTHLSLDNQLAAEICKGWGGVGWGGVGSGGVGLGGGQGGTLDQ